MLMKNVLASLWPELCPGNTNFARFYGKPVRSRLFYINKNDMWHSRKAFQLRTIDFEDTCFLMPFIISGGGLAAVLGQNIIKKLKEDHCIGNADAVVEEMSSLPDALQFKRGGRLLFPETEHKVIRLVGQFPPSHNPIHDLGLIGADLAWQITAKHGGKHGKDNCILEPEEYGNNMENLIEMPDGLDL
eukprot:TRINITY_DN7054_c0_g1_i5.p1 TRINITY_DN7054_c0_g1~~TRINITY_DN7054_c0_g1_i5.p1  ORF type:complete len:214 (+),score=87.32 TRINITY_DN7054_c0_g1_i5:80-643(+)